MGEKLKRLRLEKGLTQKQVAEQIGLSIKGYNFYELNLREPPNDTLKKLCNIFNVSADYLLGLEREREEESGSMNNEKNTTENARRKFSILSEVSRRLEWDELILKNDSSEKEKEILATAKISDLELLKMVQKKLLTDESADK